MITAAIAAAAIAGVGPQPSSGIAQAPSPTCRSACLTRYNECRLINKGASSCDVQYQACLQLCVARR